MLVITSSRKCTSIRRRYDSETQFDQKPKLLVKATICVRYETHERIGRSDLQIPNVSHYLIMIQKHIARAKGIAKLFGNPRCVHFLKFGDVSRVSCFAFPNAVSVSFSSKSKLDLLVLT